MKMIAQNPYFVRVSRLGNLSSPPLASLVGEPPIKVGMNLEVFQPTDQVEGLWSSTQAWNNKWGVEK